MKNIDKIVRLFAISPESVVRPEQIGGKAFLVSPSAHAKPWDEEETRGHDHGRSGW